MAEVYFDIETRSTNDLKKEGKYKYFYSSFADIVSIAYRIGLDGITNVWVPDHDDPPEVFVKPQGHTFYAFNISFDRTGINKLGGKYGLGHIKLEQCVDVQALVARYGYPQKLDTVAQVLLGTGKLESGTRLINRISKPPFEYTHAEFEEFLAYNKRDVDIMCDLLKKLPNSRLSPYEQKIWEDTEKINAIGVPVDLSSAQRIQAIVTEYIEDETECLCELTDGEVVKITQVAAIKNYVNDRGGDLPDVSKETLASILNAEYLPDWMTSKMLKLLQLRQLFGSSSIAKYKSIMRQYHKGRIYDNLRYFGAHTGRETGRGFQIHNLPRAKVKDPDAEIQKFYTLDILKEDPVFSAKALIRPMIRTGKKTILGVWDYKSIENRILYWFARDYRTLFKVKQDFDEYVEFASIMYKLPPDKIGGELRNFGKVVVLGSGYGLSPGGLFKQCSDWGLDVTYEECERAVYLYRNMHPKVKAIWYQLSNAAKRAVMHKGVLVQQDRCKFVVKKDRGDTEWLTLRLPSGRNIYYNSPSIAVGNYGPEVHHMGVDSTTKKWSVQQLYHSRIIENIIQALARDVLMYGRRKIIDEGYNVIASIHDENVVELPYRNHKAHWQKIKALMEIPPPWLDDMTLAVEGYCSRRYKKD